MGACASGILQLTLVMVSQACLIATRAFGILRD